MSMTQLGPDVDGKAVDNHFLRPVGLTIFDTTAATGAIINQGTGSSSGHKQIQWDTASSRSRLALEDDVASLTAGETTTLSVFHSGSSINFAAEDHKASDGTLSNSFESSSPYSTILTAILSRIIVAFISAATKNSAAGQTN